MVHIKKKILEKNKYCCNEYTFMYISVQLREYILRIYSLFKM